MRTDVLTLGALGAAAALGIAFLILRTPGGSADPLGAVPADSFMVVSIDVAALAQSPLGEALVGELRGETGERAEKLLGVDSITTTCGFDPLPHLRALAIAVPEGDGERGDFGVAAAGTFTKEALETCAKAVITKRGGSPSTRQSGTFTVISDSHAQPGTGAEIAFRDGGPYLVGRGIWLTRMIDAADGRTPSTLSDTSSPHAKLRAALSARDIDAEAVRATALVPRPLRERLQHELAAEPRDNAREKRGSDLMEGVLGVAAAAFALHAGRAHEDTRALAELRCDTADACDAVRTLILHTRLRWSGNFAYRLVGLGPLIDNLEVTPDDPSGTSLYVHTRAPADDLAKVLDRTFHPEPKSAPPAGASAPLPASPRSRGEERDN